jgi:AcrR family transcriptional regulator
MGDDLNVRDKVLKAGERLAESKPFDQITFAEIAQEAGVHWTAVRRHLGDKQEMRSWLQEKQTEHDGSLTDTRTRILDAAAKMFAEQGYANASLEKVASAAGLTKGAVYWHFSSKQDLFLAILEHSLNQQLRLLPGQIEHVLEANDPETALSLWLQSQFDCLDGGEAGAMLIFEFVTSSREPEVREKLQAIYGKMLDTVAVFLTGMQKKGTIAEGLDPQYIGIMVSALNKGILMEWLIDPKRCQLQPLIQTVSKVLWRGLAPKK